MATVALAAIGKVFAGLGLSGAASAGAGAAATAATATAGTAAVGSGALGVLSGVSTLLKVVGTIGAGRAAAAESRQLADQADLSANQEQLAGEQRKTKMTRELARVLGNNDVAYAAAGIDLTQGVAASNAASAKARAADEISIDQQDTDFKRSMYRMRASNLRDRARSQKGGAMLSALGDVAGFGIDLASRG
ncbi:hypothetical protein ACIQUB_07265 [Rhizobium sp. NPDC090275]|uniref:hypothetical protein n=1 Tax=Rhizobium sp. NPDC090275 TaxID=3364498 RepID=UPI00383A3EA6